MKKVLFLHPRKATTELPMPHLGLGSLSAMLLRAGHRVEVLDEVLFDEGRAPHVAEVIRRMQPDVVGVSTYTATLDRVLDRLRAVRAETDAPILAGGPHATLFPEQLAESGLVDYVVTGEAEDSIVGLVGEAARQPSALVVRSPMPDVRALPWPDYTPVIGSRRIRAYPLLTSRGCPYACSFCAVGDLLSRRWRPRDPEDCANEAAHARQTLPDLRSLQVGDDCPTCKPEHFKAFLRRLREQRPPLALTVANTRADRVDDELVALMRDAGATSVCLGVEHGHPEVFALVNKGESLEDIERAAAVVRSSGLELGLCFIVGLPGDSLDRTRASIVFARRLRPDYIFWNMAHPFPGTAMWDWFREHGAEIDDPRAYTSYDAHSLRAAEPMVSTADFPRRERVKAYLLAAIETDQYVLSAAELGNLMRAATSYGLAGPALRSLIRRIPRAARTAVRLLVRRLAGAARRPP